MEFCPNCESRLIQKPHNKAKLDCPKCGSSKEEHGSLKRFHASSLGGFRKSSSGLVVIDRKAQRLRTLPQVDRLCGKCGGGKAETWSMSFGSEDNSQTTFYRCVSCGHTWREND